MISISRDIGNLNKTEIDGFVILIFCYLFRTAIPALKYPFIVLFVGYLTYSTIHNRKKLGRALKDFLRTFYFVLILAAILIFSFFSSQKLYLEILKTAINGIILLVTYYYLTIIITRKDVLRFFIQNLILYTIYFALIISLLGLLNFYTLALPDALGREGIGNFLAEEATLVDYNFALLPVFFGIVALFITYQKASKRILRIAHYLFITLFILTVLFSGSRRGIFAFIVIYIILLAIQIIGLLKRQSTYRKIGPLSAYFLISTVLLYSLFFVFLFKTSNNFKTRSFKLIGLKSVEYVKTNLVSTVYSYSTLVSRDLSYYEIYDLIWPKQEFDPLDPDSGWGYRDHKTIFPLTGDNVEIVPNNVRGYLLDRFSNSETWEGNAYSFTLVAEDSLSQGELFNASVFCYVAEEFNGTWARISAEGRIGGLNYTEYDMSRKGTWQKLSLVGASSGGKIKIYLYFAQYGHADFSSLNGHVIFAYPEYKSLTFDARNPATWGTRKSRIYTEIPIDELGLPDSTLGYLMDNTCDASTWNGNAYSYTCIGNIEVTSDDHIEATAYCFVSEDFNGTWVRLSSEGATFGNRISEYDLNNKGTWQKLSLDLSCREGKTRIYLYFSQYGVIDFSNLKGKVIFSYPQVTVTKTEDRQHLLSELSGSISLFSPGQISAIHVKQYISTYMAHAYQPLITLLSGTIQTTADRDPLRSWISRVFSEDTTYYGYHASITVDTLRSTFLSERLDRWEFAWQLFIREYNWKKKLIGDGFDHLNWYGYYFYGDKTQSDWPHNPFLSILLYSGIIGLIIYILFIYRVVYYYLLYFKEYGVLFLYFLLTYYFAFFSGETPFDPPILGFLIMIPFFVHHFHRPRNSS